MNKNEVNISNFNPNQYFFEDLKKSKFVLVLGAGFSSYIKNNTKETDLPSEFNIPFEKYKNIPLSYDFNLLTNLLFDEEEDTTKYQAAANLWEDCNYIIKGLDLSEFYRNLFIPDKEEFLKTKQELYRNILLPTWQGIYTFNFDTLLETIVKLDNKTDHYYSKYFPEHKGILPKRSETYIAHLHGIITTGNLKNLVFSTNGYENLKQEKHTLYDTLHNDAHENIKLFIVGTQFDEEIIDDNFFLSLKDNVTIYHFDRKNNDFKTKPNIRNNENYHFIRIENIADVLNFFKKNQVKIENNNFTQYLNQLIEDDKLSRIDRLYINLFGQEDVNSLQIDSIGIELLNEEFATTYTTNSNYETNNLILITEDECYEDIDTSNSQITQKRQPRVDTILNIEHETQRFIIVGSPGSGKTTTLKKILFQNVNSIINDKSEIKIPVFIQANEYKRDKNFRQIISEKLEIDNCESLLLDGKLQLLVDGINEIDQDQKKNAYRELSTFINEYLNVAIILTTRKTNFINEFNLPVFELKELQKKEIKEFISKRNPENYENIWSQLENSNKLLELAHNPLYLTMIVIASKDGIIPNNRGALFDSFIHALLIREKLFQLEINSIIDILSELAFFLKMHGMVSVPKERAEKLIIERIESTHNHHSPIDLLAKVKICNLITINSNISFIHEGFLDYFTAVKIKYNFNSLFNSDVIKIEDIGIKDIVETRWYEPLIMCGDLFREKEEEKQALDYFNLLYKGSLQKVYSIKKIDDFTKEDWNENLKIPCKVAYNLKATYPNIFITAERYLSNYMTLWLINYRNSNEIIPLENLFEAISSLSSPKLFDKILFDSNWQEVWLYSPSDDSKENNLAVNKFIFEKANILRLSIVENISDFDTLCKLLFNDVKLKSCVFPRIIGRIGDLEHLLLRRTSIVNIKNTFLRIVSDIDLLKFISYVDPDFFIKNFNKEKWGVDEYINQLIQVIHFHDARVELLNNISFLNETQQTRIIINFLKYKYFEPILDYLNSKIDALVLTDRNFESIKFHLKLVPINFISEEIQKYFFSKNYIFSANYKFIKFTRNNRIKVQLINVQNLKSLKLGTEVIVNNLMSCRVESIDANYPVFIEADNIKFSKQNLAKLRDENIRIHAVVKMSNLEFDDISELGTIADNVIVHNKDNFISEYRLISKGYDQIRIELFNSFNIDKLLSDNNMIIINNKHRGCINQKKIITQNYFQEGKSAINYMDIDENDIEKYQIYLFLLFSDEVEKDSIEKYGSITITDFRGFLLKEIHPDNFVDNYLNSENKLSHYEFSKKELKEIARLGLIHKFHKSTLDVNYGIVISKYNLSIRVLSLLNKNLTDFIVTRTEIISYSINQIVVIEDNREIGFINTEDQKLDKIGYLIDEIIRIDYEKREGHIRKNERFEQVGKDYYFHFDDCDFPPYLGDVVSFLPAINVFPSSFGLPKAYRITRIRNVSKCKIVSLNYDLHTFELSGSAYDNEIDEELIFKISKTNRLFLNKPKLGEVFSYHTLSYISEYKKRFIKLFEKIKYPLE